MINDYEISEWRVDFEINYGCLSKTKKRKKKQQEKKTNKNRLLTLNLASMIPILIGWYFVCQIYIIFCLSFTGLPLCIHTFAYDDGQYDDLSPGAVQMSDVYWWFKSRRYFGFVFIHLICNKMPIKPKTLKQTIERQQQNIMLSYAAAVFWMKSNSNQLIISSKNELNKCLNNNND